ncbi:SPOR domain-containing protein [Sphingomonas parva]|uniref:SPOR domain-containing protein n=1 Tax=Sphingomonas parva TaxID=2555898 RepID=A0A4Y8ZRM3_9SPHN|nr:SPOR domain-containing protein [Sphingomonas parva]TFI57952.1 SPOR domain-containing protein [Sphingomonas parva]
MTDARADDATPFEEDRLPWLEAVEDDDGGDGPSALKMIVGVLIALAGIGAIVGGIFWMNNRSDQLAGGDAELIKAPEGDYKVRPDDPGGMAVEGEGDTAFAASEGADPKGAINTNAVAEAPVGPGSQPQPSAPAQPKSGPLIAAPAPTNAPAATATATATPPAAGPGGTVQLGAFSSQASANSAWKALSGRFAYLAPLSHSVVPVTAGGKTLYRLRASGPGAGDICGRLRVAGESCVSVD